MRQVAKRSDIRDLILDAVDVLLARYGYGKMTVDDVAKQVGIGGDKYIVTIAPGERTGRYRTTGDQFLVDAAGRSFITFEDYAVAALDELEHPQHVGRRFGVAY